VLITDKLKSYAAAKREIMPGVEHRQHIRPQQPRGEFASTYAATRADHEAVQVTAPGAAIFSSHDQIENVFSRRPSQDTAATFHAARSQAFTTWAAVTGVAMAA
jgi:putative transposase